MNRYGAQVNLTSDQYTLMGFISSAYQGAAVRQVREFTFMTDVANGKTFPKGTTQAYIGYVTCDANAGGVLIGVRGVTLALSTQSGQNLVIFDSAEDISGTADFMFVGWQATLDGNTIATPDVEPLVPVPAPIVTGFFGGGIYAPVFVSDDMMTVVQNLDGGVNVNLYAVCALAFSANTYDTVYCKLKGTGLPDAVSNEQAYTNAQTLMPFVWTASLFPLFEGYDTMEFWGKSSGNPDVAINLCAIETAFANACIDSPNGSGFGTNTTSVDLFWSPVENQFICSGVFTGTTVDWVVPTVNSASWNPGSPIAAPFVTPLVQTAGAASAVIGSFADSSLTIGGDTTGLSGTCLIGLRMVWNYPGAGTADINSAIAGLSGNDYQFGFRAN